MKRLLSIIVILFFATSVFGQDPEEPDLRTVVMNKKSGYININELTYAYGLGSTDVEYSKQHYGILTMHGYKLIISRIKCQPSLAGGLGAGILFYNEGPLFPIFLDARLILTDRKVSPFLYGNGGLLLSPSDIKEKSKLLAGAGAGLRIKLNGSLSLVAGPGLLVQWNRDNTRDSFVNVRMGLAF